VGHVSQAGAHLSHRCTHAGMRGSGSLH
jgi:hypothetical protein